MKRDFTRVRLAVLLTDGVSALPFETLVREVLAGGADCIQLREKSLSDSLLLQRARLCRNAARERLFIVNDRPDIAVLSGADGVHVGPDDLPADAARRIVGGDCLVGVSAYGVDDLVSAQVSSADYVGVGAAFPTATKNARVTGLALVREAARVLKIPFLAVGGINLDNVASVIHAGARGVAVSSAILSATDPRAAATAMKSAVLRALAS